MMTQNENDVVLEALLTEVQRNTDFRHKMTEAIHQQNHDTLVTLISVVVAHHSLPVRNFHDLVRRAEEWFREIL